MRFRDLGHQLQLWPGAQGTELPGGRDDIFVSHQPGV